MELKELVIQVKNIQAQRKVLEAQAKELKTKEDELKEQIISYMTQQNMPSVHFKDLAQVVITKKQHLEVTNKELFTETVLRSLVTAYQERRPFVDGMLVQLRPSKEAVLAYLEHNPGIDFVTCGLRSVVEPELSFRKS